MRLNEERKIVNAMASVTFSKLIRYFIVTILENNGLGVLAEYVRRRKFTISCSSNSSKCFSLLYTVKRRGYEQ
jgi:hypothetical protein